MRRAAQIVLDRHDEIAAWMTRVYGGAVAKVEIEIGVVSHVNDSPINAEDNTAYGGQKQSGLGRFGGGWSVEEFTTHHWVSVQHSRRPYTISGRRSGDSARG